MTCEIKNAAYISVNGSCTIYGGGVVSASFSPSLLNSQNRASITVASKNLQTPEQGDNIELQILDGAKMDMIVGGYSRSNSASSISQLTINLYDKSHQFLDNKFVFLKEEVPQVLQGENIKILGRKKGPSPDIQVLYDSGIITPASDTMFIDIRAFYENYQVNKSIIAPPIGDLDTLIQEAPGKTLYFINNDPNGGMTLKEAFGELIDGIDNLPNGPYDFTGSLRTVIAQICDEIGYIAYWDMSQNKVKIESKIDINKGKGFIEQIKNSCNILTSGSSSNFTTTRAQGAYGSITSSFPGEDQDQNGGEMRRYFNARKLNPTFHIRENCASENLVEIDFADEDILKIITASEDPKVYAMYALQTMLAAREFDLNNQVYQAQNPGADNDNPVDKRQLNDFEILTDNFSVNQIIKNYYGINAAKDGCKGMVWNAVVNSGTQSGKQINNELKESNEKPDIPPISICGEWEPQGVEIGGNKFGAFKEGALFLHKKGTFTSIIDDQLGLQGESDILMKYLRAIYKFRNTFYVVPEQSGLRSVKTPFKNYGYYITSTSGLGADAKTINGFEEVPVEPFEFISDCGISEIIELAKTCAAMYLNDGCEEDFIEENTVIDFIHALDKGKIKNFFQGQGVAKQKNKEAQTEQQSQQLTMFLIRKVVPETIDPLFAEDTKTCFNGIQFYEDPGLPAPAKELAEKLGSISLSGKDNPFKELKEDFNIGWIIDGRNEFNDLTSNDMHSLLTPRRLTQGPTTLRLWFDPKGNSASVSTGLGQFQLSDASAPPSNENTWKSDINQINVNAADIAQANGINQTYLADASNDVFTFSRLNVASMQLILGNKIQNSTWSEDEVGKNETITFLLHEDVNVEIPGPEDGLDNLDIRGSDGKVEVSVTIGNTNLLTSRSALRDLKSKNSHLLHGYMNILPDQIQSLPNTRFSNIAKGNF